MFGEHTDTDVARWDWLLVRPQCPVHHEFAEQHRVGRDIQLIRIDQMLANHRQAIIDKWSRAFRHFKMIYEQGFNNLLLVTVPPRGVNKPLQIRTRLDRLEQRLFLRSRGAVLVSRLLVVVDEIE